MLGSIRLLLSVAVLGILMFLPAGAGARAGSFCRPGQSPQFVFGFAALKAELGPIMGEPTTCEYPDPNGSRARADRHGSSCIGLPSRLSVTRPGVGCRAVS